MGALDSVQISKYVVQNRSYGNADLGMGVHFEGMLSHELVVGHPSTTVQGRHFRNPTTLSFCLGRSFSVSVFQCFSVSQPKFRLDSDLVAIEFSPEVLGLEGSVLGTRDRDNKSFALEPDPD